MVVLQSDVVKAYDRIADSVRHTPVLRVADTPHGGAVWLKLEYHQYSGSFKVRGAYNRIRAAAEVGQLTDAGVIVASGGNAGLAVAYVARHLQLRAEVFVPTTAPQIKVKKLRASGARVTQVGTEYADAYSAAMVRGHDTGALICHAYDQPEVVAGNGTIALELQADIDGFDSVIVAVGGGGLMAGVTAGLDGAAQVIAAEPKTIPTLNTALVAGGPVTVDVSGVAADSLGARKVGDIALEVAQRYKVRSMLVTDNDIVLARSALWENYRIAVEHGTAAAIAVLNGGYYEPEPGERVVVVLCGANTDLRTLT